MKAIRIAVRSRFRRPFVPPYRLLPVALILVLGLSGGLIAAMSNLKTELVKGPNRALAELGEDTDYWIIQEGSSNLVEDSFLPGTLAEQLQSEGFEAYGFNRSYRSVYVDGRAKNGLIFDVPALNLSAGRQGVVVDTSLGAPIGSYITISGLQLQITGIASGTSSPGKEGVFLSREAYVAIAGQSDAVFGVLVRNQEPPVGDYTVLTTEELRSSSQDYWFRNGGSLTDLVANVAIVFAVVVTGFILVLTFALTRKSIISTRAMGATIGQVTWIEGVYLLVVYVPSLVTQTLFYLGLTYLFRASTPGYIGGFSFGDLIVAGQWLIPVLLLMIMGIYIGVRMEFKSERLAFLLKEA